jgi:hypothetical protein
MDVPEEMISPAFVEGVNKMDNRVKVFICRIGHEVAES